jgi:Xaa-Pro aminopeptidase
MKKEIQTLQERMSDAGIDYYLIPTSDDHHSEYISDYFKCRSFFSGFTGSAGTLLVTSTEAFLWTDGRYYIQAMNELDQSGILLMKSGMDGVEEIPEFLHSHMKAGETLGFDGRLYTVNAMEDIKRSLAENQISIRCDLDLAHEIWEDHPALSNEPAYLLPSEYAGRSAAEKLSDLRTYLREHHCDCQPIYSLTDIAWLFNLRGNDIANTPVALAYAYISLEEAILFIQKDVLSKDSIQELAALQITTRPYEQFYPFLAGVQDQSMLIDKSDINYNSYEQIDESITKIELESFIPSQKAVKSECEIKNTKNCHLRDAVYMTKFMYWLKHTIQERPLSELEAANTIDQLRLSDDLALDLSFETISAYGANGAIVHYAPTPEHNAILSPKGMLLVDSGGQYLDGTTDITRTFILGEISEEEKRCFTAVCRSMLHLANARFLLGCRGSNLDCLARQPLWESGLDYRHGTGHGVGHLLSVHEGPNSFRFRTTKDNLDAVLLPGMITTDEPGYYAEGRFGIRTENELLCKKWKRNEYGQFLEFEYLTFVPIDLDGIEPSLMSVQEKQWLNDYHRQVYEKIAPHLTEDEKLWLKEYTRAI